MQNNRTRASLSLKMKELQWCYGEHCWILSLLNQLQRSFTPVLLFLLLLRGSVFICVGYNEISLHRSQLSKISVILMIITPGCLCGFRCVARYLCGCVSVLIFEKCFCSSPRVRLLFVSVCGAAWKPPPLSVTAHPFELELDEQAGLRSYW